MADTFAVGHRTQVIDALQVQSRDGKTAVPSPSGYEKLIIGYALPIIEFDHLLGGVYSCSSNPKSGLDVVLSKEVRRLDQGLLERGLAAEVFLGQRRTLVRGLRLRPDQDDFPVEALLAEGCCRPSPSQASADDHERFGHHSLSSKLAPSTRNSKEPTGTLAGPRSTCPLTTSNWEPWQGQVTVVSSRSPSANEHCRCVHVSPNA